MRKIITWTDQFGMRRCSNTVRTDQPRAATVIALNGTMSMLAASNVIIADFYESCTPVPYCDVRFL